jgi:Transposase DDE domain/Domain of unknown function (DUF4372)
MSQIMKLIPVKILQQAVEKHQSNRYYKSLPTRVHLVSLLFGVYSCCNGLREICEGLIGCQGKFSHFNFDKTPARSTLSDGNNRRSYLVFETLYFELVKHYQSFISDSRLKGLSIRNLKIIDSTTIRLFSDVLQGVGRNPQNGSRKKGGLKVHAMMDAFSGIVEFARITAAKEHDKKFMAHLKLAPNSFIVFDKAYNHYNQFLRWTENHVWFVTRMKSNAVFHVTKVMIDNTKKKHKTGKATVLKEQYITVACKGEEKRLKLRRITHLAEDGKQYVFLTNNMSLSCEQIATIYKTRWMIELLFKQVKQNFPLRYFWGESENAIKTQIYAIVIAQILMVVLRKRAKTKKSFANMITIIRLHLMSYVDPIEFVQDTAKAWKRSHPPPDLMNAT